MFTETQNRLALPIPAVPMDGFTPEQREYLAGLFAGVAARGQSFKDVEPVPEKKEEELIFEERVKRELHPLDAYAQMVENAFGNKVPDKEEVFRFKWNGLFFLTPVKDAFMARLRIPAGVVKSYQLRELARVAQELTTGYVQITTRANFQIRLIQPKDAPEVLRCIQGVGLHTRGAGADNIRNLTTNPTAGIDPVELIDTLPYVNDLAQIIINERSFYNLPRKFNVAFDGGGLIGSVEDTNDVGVKAFREGNEILFRVALGGATGHKAFARDLGVAVPPAQIVKVVCAIIRVFIERGCRTDRKKARLKHLLETMSLDEYLAAVEVKLGYALRRSAYAPEGLRWAAHELPHSHIGDFPQKQRGLNYLGVALPAGQITPKQILRLADLCDAYGSGEIRLTVWQNLIIPNVPDAFVPTLKRAIEKMGLATKRSNVGSGIIACTGNSYCKFAQSNTKAHALELNKWLEKRVPLDQPVNIHLTGCPNSCAQHYMGDIGCLGTKARIAGESIDAYHIFVGGGFGKHQNVGRQVFSGVSASELPRTLEQILKVYLAKREGRESFQQFTMRHDLKELQELFST
ncbi:MAG TPA: NirA family protein [Verrucomicrobiae bacterium]|nr:NirA family protein [Verrucomicrobiae bacterium]